MTQRPKRALAIACHPDDIEFLMSGTLMLLKETGYEIHYMNIANGDCGTAVHPRKEIAALRDKEARAAARLIGAKFHPPLVSDLEVFYENNTLAKVSAVVRKVNPEIILTQSPQDYMEDHMNAGRLAVSAAFFRSMRNARTSPRTQPVSGDVCIYHALPWGLTDQLRRRVWAESYVDVSSVLETKKEMLASHKSQKEWLDASQGMNAYIDQMVDVLAEIGRMSRHFKYAEGWRRHSHVGYGPEDFDPLKDALGKKIAIDKDYVASLTRRP